MAGPLTSTGFPLERCPAARSTTVTSKPHRFNQYAKVDPATPDPEISAVLIMISPRAKRTSFVQFDNPTLSGRKSSVRLGSSMSGHAPEPAQARSLAPRVEVRVR